MMNTNSDVRYSVSDVNKYIKSIISGDVVLQNLTVVGEISNFKAHYTGHLYFSLKDSNALIKCVMFKSSVGSLTFKPQDGTKVIVTGSVSVFERDGTYQIYVKSMTEDGVGSLAQQFEELKKKLEAQGYFDPMHKIAIPAFPKTLAVITSSTGAVIRDIINVATRRFPGVHIRLLPVAVQGPSAAKQIAYAIDCANKYKLGEVIIVGRGGGSLEDLWPFNEEIVANAIYKSELPVISAVGHETDFTICDFVADLRAPTPSAAAELAVPNVAEENIRIRDMALSMQKALNNIISYEKLTIQNLRSNRFLSDPFEYVNVQRMDLDSITMSLNHSVEQIVSKEKLVLNKLDTALSALNPFSVLERGYTAVSDSQDKPITDVAKLAVGADINLKFRDGLARCKVLEVENYD